MTDNDRDRPHQHSDGEVKKALIPDEAVTPPINIPPPDTSNSNDSSNNSSGDSSKGK